MENEELFGFLWSFCLKIWKIGSSLALLIGSCFAWIFFKNYSKFVQNIFVWKYFHQNFSAWTFLVLIYPDLFSWYMKWSNTKKYVETFKLTQQIICFLIGVKHSACRDPTKEMRHSIRERTKWNLCRTTFKKFKVLWSVIKGCLPQILLGSFFNTSSHISKHFDLLPFVRLRFYWKKSKTINA